MADAQIRDWIREYGDRVYRAALWLRGEPEAAETLCRDTFRVARLHQHRRRKRQQPAPWLLRILIHRHREQSGKQNLPDDVTLWLTRPEQQDLADALTRLEPGVRVPVFLTTYFGFRLSEASALLHRPVSTLRRHIAEATALLPPGAEVLLRQWGDADLPAPADDALLQARTDAAEEPPVPPRRRLPRRWFRRPVTVFDRILTFVIVACLLTGSALLLRIPYQYYMRGRISDAIADGLDSGEGIVVDVNALPFPGEDDPSSVVQTEPSPTPTTPPSRTTGTTDPDEPTPTPEPTSAPTQAEKVTLHAIARFDIPKIDNDSPILHGATEVTLRYGIGWYPISAPIGEEGRAVLLGHRTRYYYGIYFNRIFELEIGDEIGIVTPDTRYTYRIHDTDVVYKDDLMTEILRPAEGSQIMLVTCDFRNDPDGNDRYLVHATLEKAEPRS